MLLIESCAGIVAKEYSERTPVKVFGPEGSAVLAKDACERVYKVSEPEASVSVFEPL